MGRQTRFAAITSAVLLALMLFLSLGAADSSPGGGVPEPTSTTVPPNCDPPRMCPVAIDTDLDGYSDYDEDAYGSDPDNPASTPESWAFGSCEDGLDNDLDGSSDGADEGCIDPCGSPTPIVAPGGPDYYPYCDKDSDGDGYFDSDETNSGSDPNDPDSTPEDWGHGTCEDAADNDLDGSTDGGDAGCADICAPPPIPLALSPESTTAGIVPGTPVGTPIDGGGSEPGGTCTEDTDADGYTDWDEVSAGSDPNNAQSTPEAAWYPGTCQDGEDNDLDGLTDDADDACASQCITPEPGLAGDGGSVPPSQPCIADSDGDGIDDGTEEWLGSDPNSPNSTPEHLWFDDSCSDTSDNDIDSLTDDADPGCQPDGDGDGVPDSADNCPSAWNPDQADADNDGTGDACQDSDGDGYSDEEEISWGSDPGDAGSTPELVWVSDSCSDSADNDGDGATDAEDSGCIGPEPLPPGSGMPVAFAAKDANCDLRITAFDALLILRQIVNLPAGGQAQCTEAAQGETAPGDADCSGALGLGDSVYVLRYVVGLPVTPGTC